MIHLQVGPGCELTPPRARFLDRLTIAKLLPAILLECRGDGSSWSRYASSERLAFDRQSGSKAGDSQASRGTRQRPVRRRACRGCALHLELDEAEARIGAGADPRGARRGSRRRAERYGEAFAPWARSIWSR